MFEAMAAKVSGSVAGGMLTLGALLLCSCQSALYTAAERGDVTAVQQAVAEASSWSKRRAANVAYEKGHTAVLDALAKAGVGIAPEAMSGKILVLQTDEMGEMSISESSAPAEIYNPDAITSISYWQPVIWKRPAQDDYCRLRELKWAHGQKNKFETETNDSDGCAYTSQSYTRIDADEAIAYEMSSLSFPGGGMAGRHWLKYELKFETPNSGKFWGYDGEKYCNVNQLTGRFWLKEVAAPAVPAKKATKQTAKKKGKRRR